MKKLFSVIVSFLILSGSVPAFAEDMQGMMASDSQQNGDMGYSGGQMRRGGGPMMGKGMGHQASVTALLDGGIVILEGPRLIKYDKDLNFVKEVELKRGKPPARNENSQEPANNPQDGEQQGY